MSILFVFTSLLSAHMLKKTQTSPLGRSVLSASALSSMEENAMERWQLAGSHPSNYESGIVFLAALTCQFAISASHSPLS